MIWLAFAQPVQLAGFAVQETVNAFEMDVDGEKVLLRYADSRQLHLNEVSTNATEPDLVRWLEWEVRPPEGNILPAQLRNYREDTGWPAMGNVIGRALPVCDDGSSRRARPRCGPADRRQDRIGAMTHDTKWP